MAPSRSAVPATIQILAAIALVLTSSCGAATLPREVDGRYTISAIVQVNSDHSVMACFPPGSDSYCEPDGGIQIRGLTEAGISLVPVGHGSAHSAMPLQLTGKYSGQTRTLVLDTTPEPAAAETYFLPHDAVTPDRPSIEAERKRLDADSDSLRSHGIWVVDTDIDTRGLVVMVVATTPAVITYLRQEYGAVSVVGWLRPA